MLITCTSRKSALLHQKLLVLDIKEILLPKTLQNRVDYHLTVVNSLGFVQLKCLRLTLFDFTYGFDGGNFGGSIPKRCDSVIQNCGTNVVRNR